MPMKSSQGRKGPSEDFFGGKKDSLIIDKGMNDLFKLRKEKVLTDFKVEEKLTIKVHTGEKRSFFYNCCQGWKDFSKIIDHGMKEITGTYVTNIPTILKT